MSARIEIRTGQGTLDLIQGAETEFYVTRQVFDLNDFETRNADYTKSLRIPTTPNNVKLLNAIADNSGTTGEETRKIGCTILMDGITIAPAAWILVFKTTFDGVDQFFEATIFYGNFNMFDALSGNTIDRINWADAATDWETAPLLIASKRTYLDNNLVWGLGDWQSRTSFDFGNYVPTFAGVTDVNATGFFLYTRNIIERMLSEIGYSLVVETAPADFNTLAIACPVTKYLDIEDATQISYSSQVQNNANQIVTGAIVRGIFPDIISDIRNQWNIGTNQWTAAQSRIYNVSVGGLYSFDIGNNNNDPSRIVLYQNAIEIAAFTMLINATNQNFYISAQASALIGDIFYVEIDASATNVQNSTVTLHPLVLFEFAEEGSAPSRVVQPSEHIPQIIQSTFFANILKLFNLIMVTDDIAKTVTLNSFDVLFTNVENDLSNQIAGGREPIEIDHFLGSLGQYTYLNWIEDNLLRRDANATIQFNNEILNKENTIISMDFSACDNSVLYFLSGIDVFAKAKLPMVELNYELLINQFINIAGNSTDFTINVDSLEVINFQAGDYFVIDVGGNLQFNKVILKSGSRGGRLTANIVTQQYPFVGIFRPTTEDFEPRLAILQEDNAGVAPDYTIMQGDSTTRVPLEIGSLTASWLDSLKMSEVAATYYDNTFKSLQIPQVIRAKFNLGVLGLANFDFLRPVYLSSYNAFYYVNKIEQFKVDSLTRMELIRITEGVPKADPILPPPASNVKAHIVENTGSATILVYNLNVDGGNNVEPVGYAIFNEDQTVNFNARIRFTTGLYNMVVTNVGNGQSIGSWTLATDVTRNESLIMNVANTPLWDLGEIQYQVIEIQTI